MAQINKHLLSLKSNYLFVEIEKRILTLKKENKDISLINLGIGDITLPLSDHITKTICLATQEMNNHSSLKGYGPSQGYLFLRDAIKNNDYKNLNVESDEIFISNGTKCDSSNIQDLFSDSNIVAIADPAYPVYVDISKMTGKNIVYIPCTIENNFQPLPPNQHVDLIYLCSPNNPTGVALTKDTIKKWIDYAKKEKAIIFFDGAYEAFISSDAPHSIYEVEGEYVIKNSIGQIADKGTFSLSY